MKIKSSTWMCGLITLLTGIFPVLVSAETVVDFGLNTDSTSTNIFAARAPDVDTTNEITYAWSDSALLFDGFDALNQDIYGAFTGTGSNLVSGADLFIQDNGGTDGDLLYLEALNSSTNLSIDSRVFLMWDASDFLTNGFNVFDTTENSAMTVDLFRSIILRGLHFVIRENDAYYVSNERITGNGGVFDINGTTFDLQWGAFNPTNWAQFNSDAAGLGMGVTFTNRVFTNVTGVGLIANLDRGSGNPTAFRIADFQAQLNDVVEQPPTNTVPSAFVVDLDPSGFTNNPPDRVADVDDTDSVNSEVTYYFDAVISLFTQPSNSIPIYGGFTAIGSAGLVAAPSLQLNNGGYVEMTGEKVGGQTGGMDARGILMWDSENFLTPGYNQFDDTAESFIEVDISSLVNAGAVYAMIREGSKYYISAESAVGGAFIVVGSDSSWAEFDPADFPSLSDSGADSVTTNAFESRIFTNVTGVGFLSYAKRGSGNPAKMEFSDFRVQLVNLESTSPYDSWTELWLPADVSDPSGDFDNDGLLNVAEYALNGNPTNQADTGMSEVSNDESFFKYVHAKLVNDSNIVYRLIDATDLVFGTSPNTNGYVSQMDGPITGNYKTVTNNYDLVEDQLFVELEIEHP